jgi:predicted dehydrogenase
MDPDERRAANVPHAEAVPFDLARLAEYEGVVVASPSIHHLEQAGAALTGDAKVLVEKPLSTTTDGLDSLLSLGANRLMVGYNLRLHQPVAQLVSWLHAGRVGRPVGVRVWFGHYLPSWRPGTDYRATYSAQARLGGGILLDAIHELDILIWMLGPQFEVVGAVVDRLGNLDIDVEDTVRALLTHPEGVVVDVELDYLSRRYRRGIEVLGEEGSLRLDWAAAQLKLEHDGMAETLAVDVPVDRSYELEAQAFLAFIRGQGVPPVDGPTGAASTRLAEQIRESAR